MRFERADREDAVTTRIAFLSCFFPAFNEAENIALVLDEALRVLPAHAERFEIIVVDDGSSDATAEIVAVRAETHPEIRLISHEKNLGYGRALRTGLEGSRGEAVFFTDADRQFRLTDIERLTDVFEPGMVAIGYRIKRHDPFHRLVVARVYHHVLRLVFGLRVHDVDCAFKLLGRDVLKKVMDDLESESAFISPELMIRAQKKGLRIVEVGVPHYPRTAGRPKGATLGVILRTVREIISMRMKMGALEARESKLISPPPT
ncbi:MAG: glycosyltransferase family 2 protein [Actinomycetota bacterium]|nr:glycosyltransferase family 2 protein [Actinomycetota bacterium]